MPISHQKVPSDGWKFKEPKTNTTLITINWDMLVKSVTAHRKNNGIDVGDVEGDIEKQISENHPDLVI